jgi:hypothetical protein
MLQREQQELQYNKYKIYHKRIYKYFSGAVYLMVAQMVMVKAKV